MIKTHGTLKGADTFRLRLDDNYFKREMVRVHVYENALVVKELQNSMQAGKTCRIHSLTGNMIGFNAELDNYLYERGLDLSELVTMLKEGSPPDDLAEVFTYRVEEEKGVRVFSPFAEIKPIKKPKKWTLSHVVKAILAGQITEGVCDGVYTDDYARDAASDYKRGPISPLGLAKRLTESPSGWRVWVDREDGGSVYLSVNCHSFDNNTLIFTEQTEQEQEEGQEGGGMVPGYYQEGSWSWLRFEGKPPEKVREKLRADGWRYSGKRKAWYHKRGATPPLIAI